MRKINEIEARVIDGGKKVTCPYCGYSKNVFILSYLLGDNETSMARVHHRKKNYTSRWVH